MSKDRSKNSEDRRNPALATYLEAIREAKNAGADDYDAATVAEQITTQKHGKLPREG